MQNLEDGLHSLHQILKGSETSREARVWLRKDLASDCLNLLNEPSSPSHSIRPQASAVAKMHWLAAERRLLSELVLPPTARSRAEAARLPQQEAYLHTWIRGGALPLQPGTPPLEEKWLWEFLISIQRCKFLWGELQRWEDIFTWKGKG